MKILITGGTGLVGYALQKISINYNYNFVFVGSKDCNLESFNDTNELFKKEQPDYVIHLAAKVGGLFKNMNNKVEMFESNILINHNVLKCCHNYHIKKCISCLSTCIFPDNTEYPINETMLHNGPPHESNDSYAHAKRMLEVHSRSYRRQYNDNFICIIPCNIYGPNDNYNLNDGHVIPALIHKCYLSHQNREKFIIKGTGKPLRQFIYSEDLAKMIMWTLEKYTSQDNIILSVDPKSEISISEIGKIIANYFDYNHMLDFDLTYSDGQFKKTANNCYFKSLYGPFKEIDITQGLNKSIEWFIQNFDICRK